MERRKNKNARGRRREIENVGAEFCWGRNPVTAALENMPERCVKVFVAKSVQPHVKDAVLDLCRTQGVIYQILDNAALDRLTDGGNHQGIAVQMSPVELLTADELISQLPKPPEAAMVLLCDKIQDPHNLGAIIRSAEAAGASAVLFPKRGGCLPTGTVVKTSAGAALRMKLAMTGNVAQTVRLLQEAGFWTVGLATEGDESIFKGDLPVRLALVVGSEGDGIGRSSAKACDELRRIPMRGDCGSLNASVAAAIAMFEWFRGVNPRYGSKHD